jgi:hypothetical protein
VGSARSWQSLQLSLPGIFGDTLTCKPDAHNSPAHVEFVARQGEVVELNHDVYAYFSAFYSWAVPRLDNLPGNPCRDAGRPPVPKPRERVLNEGEMAAFRDRRSRRGTAYMRAHFCQLPPTERTFPAAD